MHDELRPGVDRPRGAQYVWAILIILLLAIAGSLYLRSGEKRPGSGMEARTSSRGLVGDGSPYQSHRSERRPAEVR